jgi:hypothetical protein
VPLVLAYGPATASSRKAPAKTSVRGCSLLILTKERGAAVTGERASAFTGSGFRALTESPSCDGPRYSGVVSV